MVFRGVATGFACEEQAGALFASVVNGSEGTSLTGKAFWRMPPYIRCKYLCCYTIRPS